MHNEHAFVNSSAILRKALGSPQSAFAFENMNGSLLHSTRKISEQLSFPLDVNNALQKITVHLVDKESPQLLDYIECKHDRSNMIKLRVGYCISLLTNYELSIEEHNMVKKLSSLVAKKISVFDRYFVNDVLFHSV